MGKQRVHRGPIVRVPLPSPCEAHPKAKFGLEYRLVHEEQAEPETIFEASDTDEATAGAVVGYSKKYAAGWESTFGKKS